MRFLFLAVSVIMANSASAQEHTFPGEYFPAFPGSHWTFMNANGDTATDSVLDDYSLVQVADMPVPDGTGQTPVGTAVFAPMLVTTHFALLGYTGTAVPEPILGYKRAYYDETNGNVGWNSRAFFSDKLDTSWLYQNNARCGATQNIPCTWRKVVTVDTSVSVLDKQYDSVVVIRTVRGSDTSEEFYAKHIGLILIATQGKLLQLSSYSIRRNYRKSQRIRIDSFTSSQTFSLSPEDYSKRASWLDWRYVGDTELWGTDSTFIFPNGRNLKPYPGKIDFFTRSPTADTLQIKAGSTSGYPVEFAIEGPGALVGNGNIAFPRTWGQVTITIRQAGDSLYKPAPDRKGVVCIYPKTGIKAEKGVDGEIVLYRDYNGPGVWLYIEQRPWYPSQILEGETGLSLIPKKPGFYRFRAIDTASAPTLCTKSIESNDLPEVEIQPVSISPLRIRPIRIRIFGASFGAWGGMDITEALTWTLWRQDGSSLGSLSSRRDQDMVIIEARQPIARGVYLVRACQGNTCHTDKVAVPNFP